MLIRAAYPEEASALACIAMDAKASWGYTAEQVDAWREALSPTAESIGAQPTYVAELNGERAGFYQVSMGAQAAELEHLWVRPTFMRQGVGRALLQHAMQLLARADVSSIEIDADPNAERFYVACGAVRTGTRPAPIEGEATRARPQLRLSTACHPGESRDPRGAAAD